MFTLTRLEVVRTPSFTSKQRRLLKVDMAIDTAGLWDVSFHFLQSDSLSFLTIT